MSGSSASPIVSRSTSFSFRASGSAMPWLSFSPRTASGSSVPAAALEPSSERPKRAPSSSAQSISLIVTAGVSPLCARSTSSAAQTPRQPSSQPPLGTASICEPTTTIFSLEPGSVAHRFPATSRSTVASVSESFPSSHSRAVRQSSLHASRRAPSGPPVNSASSCRSLSGRSQSNSGIHAR